MTEQFPGIEELMFPEKKPEPIHPVLAVAVFLMVVGLVIMIGLFGSWCALNNDTHVTAIRQDGWAAPQVLVEDNEGQRAWFRCTQQLGKKVEKGGR